MNRNIYYAALKTKPSNFPLDKWTYNEPHELQLQESLLSLVGKKVWCLVINKHQIRPGPELHSLWGETFEKRDTCSNLRGKKNLRAFTSSLRSKPCYTSDFIEKHFFFFGGGGGVISFPPSFHINEMKTKAKHSKEFLGSFMNVQKWMMNLHKMKSSLSFLDLNAAIALNVPEPVLNYSVSWQALRVETLYVEEIPGPELYNNGAAPSPRLMPRTTLWLDFSLLRSFFSL